MSTNTTKFTLDRPLEYEIRVPGTITADSLDWNGGMMISFGESVEGNPISTLNARLDQAGLHGLLQHLYSLGLPIISVVCVEFG